MSPGDVSGHPRPVEFWALAALYAFTAAALAGYGVFGLHPERLPTTGMATAVYRSSFPLFAQLHIGLSALVLAVVLVRRGGLAWLPAFVALCGVSLLSEHVGTGYGIPFGDYRYTGLLGPKVGGRVPVLIPVSWFLMALPSYALARHVFPERARRPARLALAVALLLTWDLALDPAMSHLTPYWVWGEGGPYYGMPWINLAGWAATGGVLVAILEALGARRRVARVPVSWMAAYWLAIVLMPLGMLVAAGAWGAVLTTLAALGTLAGLGAVRIRSGRSSRPVDHRKARAAPSITSATPAGGAP